MKLSKVMVVISIPVEVMLYNQSDTKFPNGNVSSIHCKKLNLKSHCIEFYISTTYSIECKKRLEPFNSAGKHSRGRQPCTFTQLYKLSNGCTH